jgi:hypothetical protein
MKRLIFTSIFLVGMVSFSFSKIIRVNNQLPTDASQLIYNTLQDAHNAASAGDTLMVEGSNQLYANLTVSKRLVIIGKGYFLDENGQTQGDLLEARVGRITINASAAGSILLGLQFSTSNTGHRPVIGADNVIIQRCLISNGIILDNTVTGLIIVQNYFTTNQSITMNSNIGFRDFVFRNNIVVGIVNTASNNQQRVFSSFENNIVTGTLNITATVFRNNILTTSSNNITVNSNTITNNLVTGNQLTGNGNQTVNSNQLFVGASGNSTDGQYKLKSDSPYLTAGFQGAEPGVFGGSTPYVLSGQPPVPAIVELVAEPFGSQKDGLNIRMKAVTNN